MHRISRLATTVGLTQYSPLKFMLDVILWTLCSPLAFVLRLELPATDYATAMLIYTGIAAVVKAVLVFTFGLFRQSWHKVGVRDLFTLIKAVGIVTLIMLAMGFILNPYIDIPRSVPLIDSATGLLVLGGLRLALRLFDERERRSRVRGNQKKVLVVGAGDTGTLLVREMERHPESGMEAIGFLDDDASKQQLTIKGLKVLGGIDELGHVVDERKVDEVLIAMPSADGSVIRRVVEHAQDAGVKYRIFPALYDLLNEKVSIQQIRNVDVEDLLRREPVKLDMGDISLYLEDKVVLITGAAGTIGAEIVQQVIRFSPKQLVLIDRNENALYMAKLSLERTYPFMTFSTFIADIQHREKLDRIFNKHKPDVVFHAAAHKHVPFMNFNPDEAILNNVVGTRNMLMVARRHGVQRFVNISTDKAVRPTSVMGASKRLAEFLVLQTALETPETQKFVSVRFGNVLGSNGSVIPIFKEQIKMGGPVTVTHPEMTRYFMSVPEAVQLVLQAASLGHDRTTYILDMGEPVKILDLANDLIRLSGFEPDEDIKIDYIGKRDGEKLFEELRYENEEVIASEHDKIMMVDSQGLPDNFTLQLDALIRVAQRCEVEKIEGMINALIPSYVCRDEPTYDF